SSRAVGAPPARRYQSSKEWTWLTSAEKGPGGSQMALSPADLSSDWPLPVTPSRKPIRGPADSSWRLSSSATVSNSALQARHSHPGCRLRLPEAARYQVVNGKACRLVPRVSHVSQRELPEPRSSSSKACLDVS